MNIIRNHLNYHNYTGEINKTQSHKEFKSIIYQLMPICFGILKFQSTFYNRNFPFYNTGTRTNARHTIDTRPPLFPLTPLSIFIFNLYLGKRPSTSLKVLTYLRCRACTTNLLRFFLSFSQGFGTFPIYQLCNIRK